jgi:hypothetical protein
MYCRVWQKDVYRNLTSCIENESIQKDEYPYKRNIFINKIRKESYSRCLIYISGITSSHD